MWQFLATYLSLTGLSLAFDIHHSPPNEVYLANWTVGQTVQTSSGPVQGHAAPNATEVSEYLGIPYALPPVGYLRFQPPLAYSDTDAINGTDYGFKCMQFDMFGSSGFAKRDLEARALPVTAAGEALLLEYFVGLPAMSEDCLTLNVWTKPQVGEGSKAVLIWIHGGGYTSGSSAVSFYKGQHFAELEDVVIVSINYRLNIFGFPGSSSFTHNLGLLDQRLAIEWVRDNIAGFGGDPNRITLFGQSAGGGSVGYHSYAWNLDPIAQGFIIESGVNLTAPPSTSALDSWITAAKSINCTDDDTETPELDECMQITASAQALLNASAQTFFGPSVDDTVVFANYTTAIPVNRPVLVGNNDNEPGLTKVLAPPEPDEVWQQQELGFTCPAAERAAYYVLNGIPTWRYRWFGDFPNLRLTVNPTSGAWHGSEILPLFNTIPQVAAVNTPAETSIGAYLRGAWATFAKDPVQGLRTYGSGWPLYGTNESTLIRLAFNNVTGTNLAAGNLYDDGCPFIPVVTSA